jgi:hypothetical protein
MCTLQPSRPDSKQMYTVIKYTVIADCTQGADNLFRARSEEARDLACSWRDQVKLSSNRTAVCR